MKAPKLRLLSAFLLAALAILSAQAHDPSKSFLSLVISTNEFTGQWDVPLKDLQSVVSMDDDKDGVVTWDELNAHYADAQAYARSHLSITADGRPVRWRVTDPEPTAEEFNDGAYLELPLALDFTNAPQLIEINYTLFFHTNSLHRGMLRLEALGRVQSAVFSPDRTTQTFQLGAPSLGAEFISFLNDGIGHIWTGYDHILFLLSLLLPAVLRREGNQWRGADAFRPAFIKVFKIVTAFTVAHSITLSLATLHIVSLPSRLTESAIAATVVLAAAINLRPMISERGWIVAFVFGLIHGFGFANALSEHGLNRQALAVTLLGFNLGVELGQLAIVAVFLPLAFRFRSSGFYQHAVLKFGSSLIILIACAWFVERVFNLKFMPF